jgi:hypothetical protein
VTADALQYDDALRLKAARGFIRVRISVVWHSERTHLLHYTRLPPTYTSYFVDKKALAAAAFAVRGTSATPHAPHLHLQSASHLLPSHLLSSPPISSNLLPSPPISSNLLPSQVRGKRRNPHHFHLKTFMDMLEEVQRGVESARVLAFDFLFWRWPYVSGFVFVLYQVTWPDLA